MKATTISLYKQLLETVSSLDLSESLQLASKLAHELGDNELEKWAGLELNGYIYRNYLWTSGITIPKYRTVKGILLDSNRQPIWPGHADDFPLPDGVVDLENYLSAGMDPIPIRAYDHNDLLDTINEIRERLRVDALGFNLSNLTISFVFHNIRLELKYRLTELRSKYPDLDDQSGY